MPFSGCCAKCPYEILVGLFSRATVADLAITDLDGGNGIGTADKLSAIIQGISTQAARRRNYAECQ